MNVKLLRIIDKYIFGLLIIILFPLKYIFSFNRKNIIIKPKKILIIRLRALGSSLLTFPMIKQLEDYYWNNVEYDLLATSRNIWVFKNQWYFDKQYSLFKIKDLIKLICGFKKYDIVIDAEEYFMISSFVSLWTGKVNIWYNNIKNRGFAYLYFYNYSEKQHNMMSCLGLLTKLWIKIYKPDFMEKLVYQEKDKTRVDDFLNQFDNKKIICLHTWWAETSSDRFRSNNNWVRLIEQLIKRYWDKVIILLSWTKFEENWIKEIIMKLNDDKNTINICWIFNLFEFAYLLENSDLMISNDTWPMHLAAAMWTKTIWLFGPNLPQLFGPRPLDKNIWIYKWNWIIYIKPHLWKFKKDISDSINKITPEDIAIYMVDF